MQPKLFIGTAVLAVLLATSLSATQYSYDNLGRLWVVTYDNGMQVTYNYDSAGNRTSVVTQTGTNRPPQIVNDNVTVNENGTITFNPLTYDTDPNGYTLSITGVGASNLAGSSNAPITLSSTSNSITYTPATGYIGKDYFTYAVTNSHGGTGSATIYTTVGGLGPTAKPDNVTTAENTPLTYSPLTNDIEPSPPGYTLSIASTTTPSHGSVVISGTSLIYTPASNYVGTDSFNYTISDGHGLTSTAVDTITIGSPPVAVANYVTTPVGTAVTFDPRVNDSDPNNLPLSVSAATTPAHGTNTIVANNTQMTYTPAGGYSGLDTSNYTIADTGSLTATASSNVCVGYAAPVAPAGGVTISRVIANPYVPSTTYDPATNDTIACGQTPTITAVTQGVNGGTVTLNSGSSVTYTYYASVNQADIANDVDTFTYTITEPFGGTATATVTVNLHITCPSCGQGNH